MSQELLGNSLSRPQWRRKSRSAVSCLACAIRRQTHQEASRQFLCSSLGADEGVREWVGESAAEPSSSNRESSKAGSLIVYFSVAQLPRSCSWHRSLQNGNSASVAESVGFLQMGQRCFIEPRIPQS